MQIQPFDPSTATEADWAALNAFDNQRQAEFWPDDPSISLERTITNRRLLPAWIERHVWLARSDDGRGVIGLGSISLWDVPHNRHLANIEVSVLPAYRRQAVGAHLLAPIVAAAEAAGRTTIFSWAEKGSRDGNAFALAVGAKPGIPSSTNQLDMRNLDLALMRRWIERAQERAAGFRVGFWDRVYPDEALEGVLRMGSAMNDAPHDEGVEPEHWTAEIVRALEKAFLAEGTIRWTAYVQETATGEYAGYSELFWRADRATIMHQGDTAVLPAYRNLGLGRWLKAAMILRVVAERPEVRYIRTDNADANQPMLSINYEMGFRPYRTWTSYMLDVDVARAYLERVGLASRKD